MKDDCPSCHALASVERPARIWWVAHAAAWVYAFVSSYGAAVTGPFIVALLPPLFVGGLFLVISTYARATATPQCAACGKLVFQPRPRVRERRYGLVHQPA